MADAMMMFLGEAHGVNWYWAQPGEFKNPGVYYWDGARNVLCVPHLSAPEAPAQGDARKDRMQKVRDFIQADADLARGIASTEAPAQPSVPAPWREAVKVAREALVDVKHGLEGAKIWAGMQWHYNPLHPFKYLPLRDKTAAALAQLDALEGGE